MVNIPAAQVEAVEDGGVVSRHTAVVGKVDRPSPIVNSQDHEINFNPFWTVPASIIKQDLIPLMQKDPNYLDREPHPHLRPEGQRAAAGADQLDHRRSDQVPVPPGPGRRSIRSGMVKINFPSPDGVYMHDTPHKGLFNNEFRFNSSGCVRIQNIRELIIWLLRDTPGLEPRRRSTPMFRSGERLDVKLAKPVPLFWTYVTAWATTDGVVHFRNDIYNLDGLEQYRRAGRAQPLLAHRRIPPSRQVAGRRPWRCPAGLC